jgi:hypothetical protein
VANTSGTSRAADVGTRVGAAIARDALAEGMPREWTGLDPQDADRITGAGIEYGSGEYHEAEAAAEREYRRLVK